MAALTDSSHSQSRSASEGLPETLARVTRLAEIYDTALTHINDFAYIFNRDGRFIYVNKPLLDLWNLSLDQAVGRNFFDLNYPHDLAARLQRQIQQVIETKQGIVDETPYTSPTGQTGYYEYIFSPVIAADGSVEVVAGSTRVITARKQLETERERLLAALENERSRLATIIEQAPAFICTLRGPDLVFELANSRYYEIVGDRQIVGKPIADALPELKGQGFFDLLRQVYQTGESYTGQEMPVNLSRGGRDALETRFVNFVYQALRDADGAVTGVFVHGVDVTETVVARQAAFANSERLRTSEERLAFAIESADLGTFYCPVPLGIIEWNAKCKEHFWLPADAVTDFETFYLCLHPDDRERTRLAVEEAVFNHKSYDIEYRTVSPAGQIRWVRAKGRAYYDDRGEPTRFDGVTLDVTDQKRIESELLESESRFRELADAMPQIVWATRSDGVLDYCNRRWFDYTGASPAAALGEINGGHYVHPGDLDRVAATWSGALASGQTYNIEFRIRGNGGGYRWFLVRAEPSRDVNGRIVRWYGTCTDIESRKRGEDRDRFLLLLDETVRPLVDPDEITSTCARLLGEHLGVDRCAYADVEEDQDTFNLTGDYNRGVQSIVGRYRFARFGQECLELMRANRPYVVDDVERHQPPIGDLSAYRATQIQAVICVPLHKGSRFVAAMAVHQATPRRWTGDEIRLVTRVASRCWESIERTRVERSLRISERRFRDMADTAPAILWVTEPDGYCSFLSRGWYELTGQTEETGLGLGWTNASHPDDRQVAREAFIVANANREPYAVDFRVRRADGQYRWVIDAGRPRFGADGEFLGFIGSVIDITDRKQAEEERERLLRSEQNARADAVRTSQMKDEFLATLSHELRTPLSAILGWSQILRRSTEKAEVLAQGLDTIERNARVQAQIIEDLLDMSRIISGKVSLNAAPTNLSEIVRAAIETVSAAANAKAIEVLFAIPSAANHPVLADPSRLQQVFWNLLSNAIKFTPRGGVVRVRIEQSGPQWQVEVIDTGEGITPEFLPYVFERFRQQDGSTTRRHGGLGLGLSIVKQLVELHGGTVRVSSDGPGKGAIFTVALPIAIPILKPDAQRTPYATGAQNAQGNSDSASAQQNGVTWDPASCENLSGVKVLVVDDEPDARALLVQLFNDCKATTLVAAGAEEALQLVESGRPDVLVSDIGMPDVDGYRLLRSVRELGAERGGAVPAIALTAYARAEDRVKAVRAGFQMHVPKPVEPAELIAMVASLVSRK